MAGVWALPYRPDCDSLAWESDPAIARVGNECIRLSEYLEKLRVVERGIEYTERELATDAPNLPPLRERHQRVLSYGPETVALADAVADSILYQRAVAGGHTPTSEEVSTIRDRNRVRSEGSADFVELLKLVARQDHAGVKELLERTKHPDLKDVLKTESLSDFMASFGGSYEESDLRELEKTLEEGEAYLESIGRERYWNEIYPEKLRREMAVAILEEAILDASADGPYAEAPRLGWLAYQQEALNDTDVKLTEVAPLTVSVDRALAYLAEFLTQEQEELREEYRRLLERREERRRLTPPPTRPNSN